jgi:hypothetical protein
MIETRADILWEIGAEAARAEKHGKFFANAHEAYGVILEEVEEFWDIVKLKKRERSRAKMREELIQIAAMAVKGIESIDSFYGGEV